MTIAFRLLIEILTSIMHSARKIFLSLSLFYFTLNLQGQSAIAPNLHNIDNSLYHFGFSLGMNSMGFDIVHDPAYVKDGYQYLVDNPALIPGFTVGIVGDLRLHRYLNFRVAPYLHFGDRILQYVRYDPANPSVLEDAGRVGINTAAVDIPLLVKYSAERYKNMRPYVIAGGGAVFDLTREENALVNLNTLDYYFCVGVGTDLYFPFFKLAPELKFGFGTADVLGRNIGTENPHPEYTMAISKLRSRFITLVFNIE